MRHGQTHYKYNNVSHTISFTDSSVQQSSPVSDECNTVRLVADQDCYVVFETELDASSTQGVLLKAGVIEYFAIDYGQEISAIRSTTNGTLRIDEMTL